MAILVLEDESAIREVEMAYLRDAGYETAEAATGLAALEACKEHQFDAAVIIARTNLAQNRPRKMIE